MFSSSLMSARLGGLVGRRLLSTEVTAAMVKELRTLSGAPLLDCKQALAHETVQGDLKKAMDWLRAKGLKKFAQSQRVTNEGLMAAYIQPNKVSLVEVNCETDFVSMNKDFQQFVATTAATVHGSALIGSTVDNETVMKLTTPSSKSVHECLGDIISIIRENITLKRAAVLAAPAPQSSGELDFFSVYVHGKVLDASLDPNVQMGKAVGVVHISATPSATAAAEPVGLREALQEQLGKRLAMHVVASKPQYLAPAQVPPEVIEKEVAIFREQLQGEKKKASVVDGIVQGKLRKHLSEICLLDQVHVAEEGGPVVSKHLEAVKTKLGLQKLQVKGFVLWNQSK